MHTYHSLHFTNEESESWSGIPKVSQSTIQQQAVRALLMAWELILKCRVFARF